MKKKLNVSNVRNELRGGSAFFARPDENTSPAPVEQKSAQKSAQNFEQEFEQKYEQVSKGLSEPLSRDVSKGLRIGVSKGLSEPLSDSTSVGLSKDTSKGLSKDVSLSLDTDEIEAMAFELRKTTKTKVNTEIPEDWKKQIDELSFRHGVGKYDLMMYIIGKFLGRV